MGLQEPLECHEPLNQNFTTNVPKSGNKDYVNGVNKPIFLEAPMTWITSLTRLTRPGRRAGKTWGSRCVPRWFPHPCRHIVDTTAHCGYRGNEGVDVYTALVSAPLPTHRRYHRSLRLQGQRGSRCVPRWFPHPCRHIVDTTAHCGYRGNEGVDVYRAGFRTPADTSSIPPLTAATGATRESMCTALVSAPLPTHRRYHRSLRLQGQRGVHS